MATSIAKLAILLTTDTSGMQRGFAQGESRARSFESNISRLAGQFLTAGSAMAALGAEVRAARWMVDLAEKARVVEIRFEALTGSVRSAQQVMGTIHDFGGGLFDDAVLAETSRKLLAMGVPVENLKDTLSVLGDLALGSGKSMSELADVLLRLGEDGTVSFRDLKRLAREGIPIIDELAQQFGVGKHEIEGMVEAGKIGLPEIAKALERMTQEGGRFHGQMRKNAETLSGEWARLWDAIEDRSREGGSELSKVPRAILKSFNDLVLGVEQSAGTKGGGGFLKSMAELDEAAMKKWEDDSKKRMEEVGKAIEKLKDRGKSLSDSLRTPGEVYRDTLAELDELLHSNAINLETYMRGINKATDDLSKSLKDVGRESRDAFRSGMNPAADYNTSAGAAAMNAAKAEMARMVAEQKESNVHLRKIGAAIGGVATF